MISLNINSQTKLNFGLKIHPNLTFAVNKDLSILKSKNFSHNYPQIGFNYGLNLCLTKYKYLFEYSTNLSTNKVVLKFHNFDNLESYTMIKYSTLSWCNKISFGYKVKQSNKPYYDAYLVGNIQLLLGGIYKLRGSGSVNPIISFNSYEEKFPDFSKSFNTLGIGIGYKIKTELRNLRRIDYGINYSTFFTQFPSLSINAQIDNKKFTGISNPYINQIDIDFIFYFNKK